MLYSYSVPHLLEHWTLGALQSVAAAGHRLHFAADLLAMLDTAMVNAVADLSYDKLGECLVWALAMEYGLLQKELARLIAEAGTAVHVEECFHNNSLMVVVQALQAQVDRLAGESE